MILVPVPVPTSSACCTQRLAHGLVRPCEVAGDLDLVSLERAQVELAVNGKRQGVVATAVSDSLLSGLAEPRLTYLISCASFCRSSLAPLRMIR